ncbi:MAG: phosphatidate phosphatase App1 family protein [Planctomycetaceae bacterium]
MQRQLLGLVGVLVLVTVFVLVCVLSREPSRSAPQQATPNPTKIPAPTNEAPFVSPVKGTVVSPIKSDEEIVFYPTLAWFVGIPNEPEENSNHFEIEIHGCIFEAGKHAAGVKLIREMTGIDESKLSTEEALLFQQRAELFAADHERGKAIPVRIGDQTYLLPESESNGHFHARIRTHGPFLDKASGGKFRELKVEAVLRDGDTREFSGQVHLAPNAPPVVRVISDIDDTIKISQVRDKPELLLNTFCRPFRLVPGMADMYRAWEKTGARFHYVSGSPWQLYPPLAEFVRDHKFPGGSFHMKLFRPTDRSAMNLFGSQIEYKKREITALFERFPRDSFVLVGDSGEQDPTIYAGLARENPRQVFRILIRNVTDDSLNTFRETFTGLPDDLWQVFREPSEINIRL